MEFALAKTRREARFSDFGQLFHPESLARDIVHVALTPHLLPEPDYDEILRSSRQLTADHEHARAALEFFFDVFRHRWEEQPAFAVLRHDYETALTHRQVQEIAQNIGIIRQRLETGIPKPDARAKQASYRAYLEQLVSDLREWESRYAPLFAKFRKLDLDLFGQLGSAGASPQPLLELIRQAERIVVLGVAGAGKTTTLRRLALDSAQDFLGGDKPKALIPIVAALRDYGPSDIQALVADRFRSLGLSVDDIREDLDLGKFLLVFDGLNEVAVARRDECCSELRHFVETYRKNHFVFAAREFGYRDDCLRIDDKSLPTCKILPLDRRQIEDYIGRYFREHEDKAQDLINQIRLHDDTAWENPAALVHLAEVPLFLQMLILTFEAEGRIPQNQGELLLRFVDYTLTRIEPGKVAGRFAPELKKELLAAIAWEMHEGGLVSAAPMRLAQHAFVTRLKALQDEGETSLQYDRTEIWQEIQNNNLLIVDVEKATVSWPHPLFQDLFLGIKVQSLCFDPMWYPSREEIFYRFSPLRVEFNDPWFQIGITTLHIVPREYRTRALVAFSAYNPALVWEAYIRMEPEFQPELEQRFLEELKIASLSPNQSGDRYRNLVQTITWFKEASKVCPILQEIVHECPSWEGRQESVHAIWNMCRSTNEDNTRDLIQSIARSDQGAQVRKAALDCLLGAKKVNKSFLVERLLNDADVSQYLFDQMARWKTDQDTLDPLMHVARDKDEHIRRRAQAVWALGDSGSSDKSIRDLLRSIATNEPSAELRQRAVRGLGKFVDRATLNTLRRTARDSDRIVRLETIRSLQCHSGLNVLPILIPMFADEDSHVVDDAIDAVVLIRGKRSTIGTVAEAVRSPDLPIRLNAFTVLAKIAVLEDEKVSVAAQRVLQAHKSEKDKSCQLEVASGLVKVEPEASKEIFSRLLNDNCGAIREKTRSRLQRLGISVDSVE